MDVTRIAVLGSTGSIGIQTLDVVERLNREGRQLRITALAAGRNVDLLSRQIEQIGPEAISIYSSEDARTIRTRFPHLHVLHGKSGPAALAGWDGVDLVVNAIVGAAGLEPTLAGLSHGRTVALANKESLVTAGDLVTRTASKFGGNLLPIDSEHNALFQCLQAGRPSDVRRLILTASGGPFLHTDPDSLASVRACDALQHPTWVMGARITIDSATMVNKAFEIIEAHHLFSVPYEQISVVVHPQSIVHSLVEYQDGSVVAELASHDMRIPIQYALTYPERVDTRLPRFDVTAGMHLEFIPLDVSRFPAFPTVLEAARAGGSALSAVNAADETLVSRFLDDDIPFPGIFQGLRIVLSHWHQEQHDSERPITLERVLAIDAWARELAQSIPLG